MAGVRFSKTKTRDTDVILVILVILVVSHSPSSYLFPKPTLTALLPPNPSLKPTLTFISHLRKNVGLGEG